MGDLSEHFDRREFECHHCRRLDFISCELVAGLEELRAIVGRPIRIVSGWRCRTHNRAVGGATRSQHVLGKAADLEQRLATPAQARAAGFRGIGTRGPWVVHVDVRPAPATWTY
jgi:uncharacterized protein YcbK (DUF882 family)